MRPSTADILKQLADHKAQRPKYVVLFRAGDYYEAFNEDATLLGRVLGITVTRTSKQGDAVPLAAIPAHALEGNLRKLIAAGHPVSLIRPHPETGAA